MTYVLIALVVVLFGTWAAVRLVRNGNGPDSD